MGVIRLLRRTETTVDVAPAPLRMSSGAEARIVADTDGERLEVRDGDGRLVFEFDPQTGRTVVSIPTGDLALRAPNGRIDLQAAEGVRCDSVGPISIHSASGVSLGALGDAGGSRMLLGGSGADLHAPRVGIATESANLRVTNLRYRGEEVRSNVDRVKLVLGKIESTVDRVVQRARNVYQRIEGLHQLRAGRVRTQVEGDYHIRAEQARVEATGPVKIDGERIYLG